MPLVSQPVSKKKIFELMNNETLRYMVYNPITETFVAMIEVKTTPSKFDYYILTADEKLGPYDEVQGLSLIFDENIPSFHFKEKDNWFLRTGKDLYGPFRYPVKELCTCVANGKHSIGFVFNKDFKEYVHFNELEFGPFSRAFDLGINPGGDRISFTAVENGSWYSRDMNQVITSGGPYVVPNGFEDGTDVPRSVYSAPKQQVDAVICFGDLSTNEDASALHTIQVNRATPLMTSRNNENFRLVIFNSSIMRFNY